jgi:hypothetical protein
MRGFTVRGSSCPSDRKQSRRRDRQEEIEAARSEAVASAIAEDSRSVLDAYVREGARKSHSVEELVPWLYFKGISTGEFPEALQALLGEDAKPRPKAGRN